MCGWLGAAGGWQEGDAGSRAGGRQRSPSARGRRCQHKLAQVVLAAGLEQHGAVFSLLCSTRLRWDNVRFFNFVHRRKKGYNLFVVVVFSAVLVFLRSAVTKSGQQIFYPRDKFLHKGHERQLWVTRAPVIATDTR